MRKLPYSLLIICNKMELNMKRIVYVATLALSLVATAGFASAETIEIEQVNKKFSKDGEKIKRITIKQGDELNFVNKDATTHQIHDKKNVFEPVSQKTGESTTWKFEEPGEYKIRCAIHPKMKLKVTVE